MLQTSSGSLTSGELERLMLKSLTHTGLRAVSGDSRWSSWSLLATTRSPSRGSDTQARGGVPAAVAEAAVAAPGAAGLIIWAGYWTEVTAAAGAAAAELALAESLCRQASRLNLLLSLSGRFLLFLGVTIAAAAAGVDELQYRLVSTLPPTVLLLLLLLTVPLSWPQVAGGWGDVAMLQAVAGLSPPYCTPPGHPGGEGER